MRNFRLVAFAAAVLFIGGSSAFADSEITASPTGHPSAARDPGSRAPDGFVEVILGEYIAYGCERAGVKDCVPFNMDGKPVTPEELAERVLVPLKR